MLRRFAAQIARDNPDIKSMSDFSPEMWWQWRTQTASRTRWPGQINLVRCLLYEVGSLPDTTRRALASRLKKPKHRLFHAYSISEYRRIYAAAWKVVRRARQRLVRNHAALNDYRQGKESADTPSLPIHKEKWTKGRILSFILEDGHFPGRVIPNYRIDEFRALLGVSDLNTITQAVFATTVDVFSLIILFACERGFNLSVINDLQADPLFADAERAGYGVTVHSLDKPRRGPAARYFSVSLSEKAARIFKFAHAITQPAREYLAANSEPTSRLLIGRVLEGRSVGSLFKSDWSQCRSTAMAWQSITGVVDDEGLPLVIDFRRLRLTDQVINQRANQNSERVSESIYRRPDPQTHEMARQTIIRGQLDALSDANAIIGIRKIKASDIEQATSDPTELARTLGVSKARLRQILKGRLDTATVACVDMQNSPYSPKGAPCAASFLNCFSCRNAVATPKHLPRLVALFDALDEISSAVSEEVWRSDYMGVRAQLSSLLTQYSTPTEMKCARETLKPDDIEAVKALLDRRFDA